MQYSHKGSVLFMWSILGLTLYLVNTGRHNCKYLELENDSRMIFRANTMNQTKEFRDTYWCQTNCKVGVPCEYLDEVDFRIMVITYDRNVSLRRSLQHILQLDTLGDLVSVEIWIDRSKSWEINQETLRIARKFQRNWNESGKGRACIHRQKRNAFIDGQWTDTWRPKPGTREIGLILEDDIDISPMAYRWLKAVHRHYDHRNDIMGYTLQMQNIKFFQGDLGAMHGPKEDTVFMYGVLGTWGFSPHSVTWRVYQDWVHVAKRNASLKPYVEGIKPTEWYKAYERWGNPSSMWEMWHIYFSHINNLYCVYSNLREHTGRNDVLLSFNRMEPGLHFHTEAGIPGTRNLMMTWNYSYTMFPKHTVQFLYNGTVDRTV